MRHIVLDTETTGLDPNAGHRIIEIGCIELYNLVPTGKIYHQYINPQRNVPQEAFNIHGLSEAFLSSHPLFEKVVNEFLNFIGDDGHLVIHNAPFDMKFLDAEINKLKLPLISRHRVIDTLDMARKKYPGARNNLDALCKRFNVDNSGREYHGALLDSELLADVFLYLMGGRQPTFSFQTNSTDNLAQVQKIDFNHRTFPIPADEETKHKAFIKSFKEPKWLKHL